MGENAVRLSNDTSGLYLAVRDAFELDGSGDARVVERVDFAGGKFTSPMTSYSRTTATGTDTFDLTNLPSALTSGVITVGDKSMLCISVEQTVSAGTVTITPIIYDNASNVVGILAPKTFTQPYAFRRGTSSGTYVLPIQTWDVVGSYKIGLHFSAFTGTSNNFKAMSWVI